MKANEVICEKLMDYTDNGLRIGQVMTNVFSIIANKNGADPFYVNDEDFLKAMESYEKGENCE